MFINRRSLYSYANKEVNITHDRIHVPFLDRSDMRPRNMLLIPIFLGKQMAGILVTARVNLNDIYTSEEIALVKAVAMFLYDKKCIALPCTCGLQTSSYLLAECSIPPEAHRC
jgi:hypothetical protein